MPRILITGSRTWTDGHAIQVAMIQAIEAIDQRNNMNGVEPGDLVIVHGGAPGADTLAGEVSKVFSNFTVEVHPADWETHGKRAGYLRNKKMVDLGADILLAFVRDDSRGASMTIDLAREARMPVIAYYQYSDAADSGRMF